MKETKQDKAASPREGQWVPGAEPLALCMSCNGTFPLDVTDCPKCRVGLSVMIKCPSCGRIQSARHEFCIYCANAFLQESGLGISETPERPLHELAPARIYTVLAALIFVGVVVSLLLYLRQENVLKPAPAPGQTYVLAATSLRREASLDSPAIKALEPSEILDVTDRAVDNAGMRWFQVASEDMEGYVPTQDVAPPKIARPDKGYALLRHSLLGLENPEVLYEASEAVEYYQRRFPASPHRDELLWLLAERTRSLASDSHKKKALLASARALYGKLAKGAGEFAEPARQALAELPNGGGGSTKHATREPAPMRLSIVGGNAGGSSPPAAGSSAGAVRKLALVTGDRLVVNLPEAVDVSPGAIFRGVVEEDIRVNREIAVPRGSPCHLMITEEDSAGSTGGLGSISVRLTGVVLNNQVHRVSAAAVRIALPSGSSESFSAGAAAPQLPAGTRITFRLDEALLIPQR